MHAPRELTLPERVWLWLRHAGPYLGLVALNCWLFAPSFFMSQSDWLPFTPKPDKHGAYGLDLESLYRFALVLTLRRDNLDMLRVSLDFVAMTLLLVWTARSRWQRGVRTSCTTVYVSLWVFLLYHHAVAHYFERTPALFEDARLSLNLWHFISGFASYGWLVVPLAVGYLTVLSWLVARTFRALARRAQGWTKPTKLRLSAALIVPGALSLLWFGVKRDDPLWQVNSKRVVYNVRASRAEAQRLASLRSSPPDLRYEAFSEIRLQRKPDVYLLMLEAYGEILATWDMTDPYRALMGRVQERLGRAGYHAASAYSDSPVHGGTSWFAISSVHTGIQIDRPQAFDALRKVSARIPSITRFFREQGYRTHSLQPGVQNRSGLNRFDMFNHEVSVDRTTLGYHGQAYGWGVVPDQYSLGVFSERYFLPTEQPRYAFYMCVSTHYIWDQVPTYATDWKALNGGAPELQDFDASWPPFAGVEHIGTEMRREYFRSVAYEFRLLTEWLEAEAGRESVILIVGDHQPRLEWDAPGGVTMNTPVHVLSQNAALIARFRARGLQEGMYAQPGPDPLLQHSGLLSLLLSELSQEYAEPDSPKATYYPKGLPLAGLNR